MSKSPHLPEADSRFKDLENGYKDVTGNNTETLVAAGAISIDKLYTVLDSTAGIMTMTLAAPSRNGQLKIITLGTDGGNVTLTPTNIQNIGTSVTFADVDDTCVLISAGDLWHKIDAAGTTDV